MGANSHAVERAAKVLAIIRSCADAGERCPTNRDIADRVGYSSISGPASAINFLEATGAIAVQRGQSSRVVTILATGKSTAGRVNGSHHRAGGCSAKPAKAAANDGRNRLAEFADAIAEGATLPAAAKIAGMSKREAAWAWAHIRRQLGPQAV